MDKLQFINLYLLFYFQVCVLLLRNFKAVFRFSILRMWAVVTLSKIKTLSLRQVLWTNMHHLAKFYQKWSNICRDMAI